MIYIFTDWALYQNALSHTHTHTHTHTQYQLHHWERDRDTKRDRPGTSHCSLSLSLSLSLSGRQASPVILIECKECRQFSFSRWVCVCAVCASDRISLALHQPILCFFCLSLSLSVSFSLFLSQSVFWSLLFFCWLPLLNILLLPVATPLSFASNQETLLSSFVRLPSLRLISVTADCGCVRGRWG